MAVGESEELRGLFGGRLDSGSGTLGVLAISAIMMVTC